MDSSDEEPGTPPDRLEQLGSQMAAMAAQLNRLTSNSGNGGGRGNNQNGNRKPFKKIPGLSEELVKARIAKRLCIQCGKNDHYKDKCQNPPDLTTPPGK
jgi:hypothetical protein